MKKPSKLVAVVIPLSNRVDFTAEEKISLKHLMHFLGKYDKYFVVPKDLQINIPGFEVEYFEKKYFGSVAAHDMLQSSRKFYERFNDYRFILIYHLDALVFSDQLNEWCEMDFDLIGAPWIKHHNPLCEGKVGNTGFALMKIEGILKVLYSRKYSIRPLEYWRKLHASKPYCLRYLNLPKAILKSLGVRNNVRWELANYSQNVDLFWAERARHYYTDFKIPPVDVALRFAFELHPKYCFEKNEFTLPFGCHAWHAYDRDFWEQFLLK